MNRIALYLSNAIDVRSHEIRALIWAFAYFFFLLASYYILRPLRDEMGVAAGRGNLQWLFTATFFAMLAASPIYAIVTARFTRAQFIPWIYHFFAFNLVIFWLLLTLGHARTLVAQVFFVWVSVFVLFAVSIFWSFMSDIFKSEQGKRLFGFIAAGGTAGTMLGSLVTVMLASWIGVAALLLVAAALLEIAVLCARELERSSAEFRERSLRTKAAPAAQERAIGGGMFDGFALILRSPYLLGIALWVALLSFAQTFLYFIQNDIVREASADPATRTRIFAAMDLTANLLTLGLQLVLTGELIKRLGAGLAAAYLPFVFALGFGAAGLAPVLAVIIVFQVSQRIANFGFANPARETFFTVAEREEKYKAKNIIDTTVLRGGDVVWGWAFAGLRGLGFNVMGIAFAAIPLCLGWLGLSLWLGRQQEARARAQEQMQESTSTDGAKT